MSGTKVKKEYVVLFSNRWGEVSVNTMLELKHAPRELQVRYCTRSRDLECLSESFPLTHWWISKWPGMKTQF